LTRDGHPQPCSIRDGIACITRITISLAGDAQAAYSQRFGGRN